MKTRTMRLRLNIIMLLAAAVFCATPLLLAQTSTSPQQGSPMYNSATETTVTGTVEAVKEATSGRGWSGTHLQLKTEAGMFDVHVGPSWFLTQKKFQFAKGDQIEVTGSKVRINDADALIARTIKKGGSELTLRNAQGIPVWSHGHRY